MAVRIQCFEGRAASPYLDDVARLRISVFRDWPYLQSYMSDEALIVLALDGDTVVGASTGVPLLAHVDAAAPALVEAGLARPDVFYFGESVLLPEYRRHGIGHRFFDEREAFAAKRGHSVMTFAAVERPLDHPARPLDYVAHDAFWTKRGFQRRPDLVATFSWKDVGS
jgi:GNAT superfamily N-acetyltransferase